MGAVDLAGVPLVATMRAASSPGGVIGSRKGLKIPRRSLRTGSSPVPGTIPVRTKEGRNMVSRECVSTRVDSGAAAHTVAMLRTLMVPPSTYLGFH